MRRALYIELRELNFLREISRFASILSLLPPAIATTVFSYNAYNYRFACALFSCALLFAASPRNAFSRIYSFIIHIYVIINNAPRRTSSRWCALFFSSQHIIIVIILQFEITVFIICFAFFALCARGSRRGARALRITKRENEYRILRGRNFQRGIILNDNSIYREESFAFIIKFARRFLGPGA